MLAKTLVVECGAPTVPLDACQILTSDRYICCILCTDGHRLFAYVEIVPPACLRLVPFDAIGYHFKAALSRVGIRMDTFESSGQTDGSHTAYIS